jgi:hypothetical protein
VKELKLQTSLREGEWDPTVSDVHQHTPGLISLPMLTLCGRVYKANPHIKDVFNRLAQ